VCVWEFPHLGWTDTNVARPVWTVYQASVQTVKWHFRIRNTSLLFCSSWWSYQALTSSWFYGCRPIQFYQPPYLVFCILCRGGVSSTRDLGPTMTARGQSIGISIGMLPQTLIVSRLDQLSRLGARIYVIHIFFPFGATWRRLRYKIHPSATLRNLTLKKDFKWSMYQHFQFTGEYSLTNC
jgi:hypothetical protein